ncbi:putative nucleotidyltransferase with HDIG domain [Nitrosomonas sp. Nm84]|uniref:HD-GYP domain-containing protein n=1 Tax=Nitrosomonas sp. Nm84 TaxID=200124 RepID=UPI000D75953E|nr:HD-GYP domain-containing protein [Nitrosomonas sp. Nm84]PXW87251.1 putative nucleotidyltransferase with HDIG domain [Nitrosomonas sp. Nm84]
MIKKIKTDDVRLGMYIHEIRGNWLEHPFWRKSFKLDNQKDFDKLLNCNMDEIWIDTSKGLDVVVDEKPAESSEALDADAAKPPIEAPRPAKKASSPVSVEEELSSAKEIHNNAKEVVTTMFSDVRMGKALAIEEVGLLVDEISQSLERNTNALLSLVRLKNSDEYTYLHSVAVCVLMVALGRQLDLNGDQLKQVGVAGLLHDIGKMAIPSDILNKPDKLTDEELKIVKQHPQRGWKILKSCYQVDEVALDVCLHHHERMDGRGYPEKLSGDTLTLYARMGAVCDVYDAISSDRCYKKAWGPAESIRKMALWKNGHFDEVVFHAFVKTIGIYPNGTLLRLKSGRLGVVIEQSKKSLTTPIIKVFFSARANTHIPMEILDLSKGMDSIESVEDPFKWQLDVSIIQGI